MSSHESATPPVPGGQALRGLRILVADDYEDGREMLVLLLTAQGHAVTAASDGVEALAMIQQMAFDVAILDIDMPRKNGYAVAETVRQGPNAGGMVLVALSGLGQHEDKARAQAAGFHEHFTKPLELEALRLFLASVPRQSSNESGRLSEDTN